MADNSNKKIITAKLIIEGHLLKWDNVTIQISNISSVTAWKIEPPPFPTTAVLLSVALGFAGMAYTPLGGAFLIVALGFIFWWQQEYRESKEKEYLNICTNSGIIYSILFNNKEFMRKVLRAFAIIFRDGEKAGIELNMNIVNSTFSGDSAVIKEINES